MSMNYDKKSFLAGLRTALSLGRIPGEKAPAPSGVGICTEDRNPIITEAGDQITTEVRA